MQNKLKSSFQGEAKVLSQSLNITKLILQPKQRGYSMAANIKKRRTEIEDNLNEVLAALETEGKHPRIAYKLRLVQSLMHKQQESRKKIKRLQAVLVRELIEAQENEVRSCTT